MTPRRKTMADTTMKRTILVHGDQSAVILEDSPTQYRITSYVGTTAAVAYDASNYAEAERWAKAVIAYPN
jgi:cytochrome c oxidase assembly protein Cox11